MSEVLETPAVTPVDSASTRTQFNGWDDKGTPIRVVEAPPKKQDSAPADKAVPDPAPDTDQKDKKPADTASDPAPDKDTQQPRQKTKEDTERRIQELLGRVKKAEERAEAAERAKPSDSDKRDPKPAPQPAKEEYQPLDEKKYFADNPKATYEDFVRATGRHEAKWETKQEVEKAISGERQRIAQEAAAKELTGKVKDAEERYGKDEVKKIFPALESIISDPQIPMALKAMLDGSEVLVDLMYVLTSDKEGLKSFTDLCKSNPAKAIRKLVTTEALVQEQLKTKAAPQADAADKSKDTPARDESGKFLPSEDKDAAAEPKPRAPKPPSEVGGRGTAPINEELAAAKSNDFRAMDAAMTRRYTAQLKKG